MRAGIGLLLITLGGIVGYLVVTGKLPPTTSTSSNNSNSGSGQQSTFLPPTQQVINGSSTLTPTNGGLIPV